MADPSQLEHRGCRLSYDVHGSGSPVLLVQGVAVPGAAWAPQVDALSDRYRCLTFDNRGMGRSQPVGDSFTIEQMAEDALALMTREGMEAAHVVGHSMGGLIALAVALHSPARVTSLSLLCTFPGGRDSAPLTFRMLSLGIRSRIGPRRARRRAFLELIMPRGAVDAESAEAIAAQMTPLFGRDLADHPPIEMKQLAAMRKYDAKPRLAELAGTRTLVVAGGHDPIAPPSVGRSMANAIPGARYVELGDASHGAPIQFAERINGMLVEHFEARA